VVTYNVHMSRKKPANKAANKTERHQVRTTLEQRRIFEMMAATRAAATNQECTVGNILVLSALACDVAEDGTIVARAS